MKQQITKCPQCRRIIHVTPAAENIVLWRLCVTCRHVDHEKRDLLIRCAWVTVALGGLLYCVLR
jgi:Zn ribbon nucleic-acid-binding protein